jgi:hypothetical protein
LIDVFVLMLLFVKSFWFHFFFFFLLLSFWCLLLSTVLDSFVFLFFDECCRFDTCLRNPFFVSLWFLFG